MPSDANGNYTLPDGYLATTGTPVQVSQHNPPLEDLADAMSGRLPKNGAAPMTGPLRLVAGSEGQPGITFAGAPGTGFYRSSDGIGISVDGARVAEVTASGLRRGGFHVGQLIPTTRTSAIPLTVQPIGQMLSRTAYAELWAVAQAEIATGNAFYSNGNGTTTFGIGDLRGRALAMADIGAGVGFSSQIGARAGALSAALSISHLPWHNHGGATGAMDRNNPHSHPAFSGPAIAVGGGFDTIVHRTDGPLSQTYPGSQPSDINHLHPINGEGGGASFSILQPTMVCNWLLFTGV
uniref:Phage tail collar domain-containing protein n=1 Tax=Rhodopseudomonas palustris (strain DX-1) TaxID=652103 RepID=E6VGI5_RHOPX